jgi:hypothetical protein
MVDIGKPSLEQRPANKKKTKGSNEKRARGMKKIATKAREAAAALVGAHGEAPGAPSGASGRSTVYEVFVFSETTLTTAVVFHTHTHNEQTHPFFVYACVQTHSKSRRKLLTARSSSCLWRTLRLRRRRGGHVQGAHAVLPRRRVRQPEGEAHHRRRQGGALHVEFI